MVIIYCLNSSSYELLYFIGFDEKWADERVAAISGFAF